MDDLTAKLEALIRDPARVQSFEQKARDHIQQHYSWDRVAEATEKLYLEMLERKS